MRDCKINVIAGERSSASETLANVRTGNLLAMEGRNDEFKEIRMAKKNKIKRPVSASAAPTARAEFNPDYTFVRKDLKRIGALAGFFIIVLVALSFFLR